MQTNHTILGVALGLTFGIACPVDELTDHCANADGNAYCEAKYADGSRRFCSRGTEHCELEQLDGCVPARPTDDACYSPCGGRKSLLEDPGCDGVADGSSSDTSSATEASETEPTTLEPTTETLTTSETEPTSSTTSSGCTVSSECSDPALPICEDTECVACSDAEMPDEACAAKDAGTPVCGAEGACVQCTPENPAACGDTTPVCDAGTSACIGCTYHEQCPATACDIDTGACFLDEESDGCVAEVDGDVAAGADYTEIGAALMDDCVVFVHDAVGGYPESVVIDGDMKVAIVAAPDESPLVLGIGGDASPSFDIGGTATVYLHRLRINNNDDNDVDGGGIGVAVDGARVWLDQTQAGGNDGGGLVLTGGATAIVRNSFIGGDVNNVAAMEVTGATATILYSTLGSGFGTAAALRCNAAATVHVRNSLFVASTDEPEIDCAADSFETSATEAELGDMNENWFTAFSSGNFHLTGNIPDEVLTTARWRSADATAMPPRDANDPATDLDGDARPNVDDAPDVAGADILP